MNADRAPLKVGVAGAAGRMGQAIIALIEQRPEIELAAAFGRPGAEGRPAGAIVLGERADAAACDVVIDVSTAAAAADLAGWAAERGGPPLAIGATGWAPDEEAALAEAARRVAIVRAGNFSLGVNLLAGLVEAAARRLAAEDWDIEVFEAHHRRKTDAPSGTALMLGEAAARGRDVRLGDVEVRARDGLTGPRAAGAIGFSVMRAGGLVGEHAVVFAADAEILTLSHSARDRSLFAAGALRAARWAAAQPPGLYDMIDVLGLR